MVMHAIHDNADDLIAPFAIVACSLCLRVERRSQWVEPEVVIRELRSFELPAPPHFLEGICDRCEAGILARRARSSPR
jgi:hypothetical protein